MDSSAPEEDSVQFSKLSYLGCTWVKAPRSESEAQKAMATLRAESAVPIPVVLHVPNVPEGCVRSDEYTHTRMDTHITGSTHCTVHTHVDTNEPSGVRG